MLKKEVWENFVNNNIVPDWVIDTIVDKIKSHKAFSKHEFAIFIEKNKEIEEKIRKQ